MHKISRLGTKGLFGKCQHLDSGSIHAARDYEQNANGYRFVREYLNPRIVDIKKGEIIVRGGRNA